MLCCPRVLHQRVGCERRSGPVVTAQQTLDTYTAAVLSEAFLPKVEPRPEWRALMDDMAAASCAAYRGVVADPTFLQYFRYATPEPELSRLVRTRCPRVQRTACLPGTRASWW